MHGLTTELIEKMADRLQAGQSAPGHHAVIWRQNKEKSFETMPFVLPGITRITIDRRWNMAADELQIEMANPNGYYSPDYAPSKIYKNAGELPRSGYKDVMRAFNRIECGLGYGSDRIRMFTGQLQNIDIAENPPAIRLTALNVYRKLLKPIDPISARELVYQGKTVYYIIRDLCARAGIDSLVYDNESTSLPIDESGAEENLDFTISEIRFPLGTSYADAVKELLEIMNHRVTGGRYGELRITRSMNYTQQDFHNWEFDDYVSLAEGVYKYDSSILRNRVIIMADSGWQAFEDPALIDYCNGEVISSGLEVPWAETLSQKWAAADHFFLSMRRKMRRISVALPGNPAMDIGDLVKLRMLTSAVNGKYMVIAIQSNYSGKGYIDQVDLEYVSGSHGHLCEPAAGDYAPPEKEPQESGEPPTLPEPPAPPEPQVPVVVTLRDRIADEAKSYLGVYYQWGGNYPDAGYGLDCSHFTYRVLKSFGLMDSYRVSKEQRTWCKPISREELLPGDLVFYSNTSGVVNHVVMYIGNGQIIGANGGNSATTTKGIAKSKDAKVKICGIDYRRPTHFGRPPGLVQA